MDVSVRPLSAADGPACDAIMRSLPDFFAYEPGLEDCAHAVRTQAGWVAEDAGTVIGFATWAPRTGSSAEVTWMAVHRDSRHRGVGTRIIETLCDELRQRGFGLALAMTSARPKDAAIQDTYGPTRRFWEARGFLPLIELDIWDTDIALLQVKSLNEI